MEVHAVGNLTTLSSCICSGHEAVFECVITGNGATIWSGTAFDRCSSIGDRIILRHSQFNQSGHGTNLTRSCGDSGSIISRAVSVVDDSYISQLTIVNVSQKLLGANVECASDSGSYVDTEQILLTTGIISIQYYCYIPI